MHNHATSMLQKNPTTFIPLLEAESADKGEDGLRSAAIQRAATNLAVGDALQQSLALEATYTGPENRSFAIRNSVAGSQPSHGGMKS